jgi:hypothetical protein
MPPQLMQASLPVKPILRDALINLLSFAAKDP